MDITVQNNVLIYEVTMKRTDDTTSGEQDDFSSSFLHDTKVKITC